MHCHYFYSKALISLACLALLAGCQSNSITLAKTEKDVLGCDVLGVVSSDIESMNFIFAMLEDDDELRAESKQDLYKQANKLGANTLLITDNDEFMQMKDAVTSHEDNYELMRVSETANAYLCPQSAEL